MINPWESNYKSQQGNVGLGMAIAYYTSKCISVLLPLNDTQPYDLVIDKDSKLYKVQVKTTQQLNKNKTAYVVQLKNTGGSSGKSTIRHFNKNSCDIVFIFTKDGQMYEIPSDQINVDQLTLTKEWDKYKINLSQSTSAQNESFSAEEES